MDITGASVLIDYGSGNIRSVAKALERTADELGIARPIVTDQAEIIASAARVLLPGQGAYGDCLAGLKSRDGVVEALEHAVQQRKVPFLGICVGMQLLASKGFEHGEHQGLDWIGGEVRHFPPKLESQIKIPHMGWAQVSCAGSVSHPVLEKLDGESVYFAHSYIFHAADPAQVVATATHGVEVTAAVARDNILGVQFHPEKSQKVGLDLLRAFQSWRP